MKIGSKRFRLTTRKETKVGPTHLDKKRITRPELDKDIPNWKERHHETYTPGHYRLRE